MYASPIDMIIDNFQTEVVKEGENYICRAVQKVGVDVDKDELVKALSYDRNQYEKGYEDGLKANKWIPCSERLPEENEFYLATIYSREMQTAFCDILFYGAPQLCEDRKIGWYFMHDNGSVEQVFNVTAWMPLPEPWKGGEDGI